MTTNASSGGSQIFTINPYEDHPSLSPLEAEVLWEYAKLNQQIKDVRTTSGNSQRTN
jgi:DASH complex subunit DAD3